MEERGTIEKDVSTRWEVNRAEDSAREKKKLRRRAARRRDEETNENVRRMVNHATRRR